MKYNIGKQITLIDGTLVTHGANNEPMTLGKVIGTILQSNRSGSEDNHLKIAILARKCYEQKEIELDDADVELIKKIVNQSDAMSLVKGEIYAALTKTKGE